MKKPWLRGSLKDYRLIILPVACLQSFLYCSERESLKPVPSASSLYRSCTGFQYLNDKTRMQHLALQHRSKPFNIEVTFCPIYYSLVYIHNVTRSSHVIIKCKSKSNNEGRSKRGYFFVFTIIHGSRRPGNDATPMPLPYFILQLGGSPTCVALVN